MDIIQTIINRWSEGKIKEDDPNIAIAIVLAERKARVEIIKLEIDLRASGSYILDWHVFNKYTDIPNLAEIFGCKVTVRSGNEKEFVHLINDIEVGFCEVHAESERIQEERLKMICDRI